MLFQLKIILFLGILSGVSAFEKIVIVVLENQDYAVAIQDPSLSEIVSQGVLLTDYHAVTHPSQPNYYAIVAGDTFFNDDNLHDINAKTIVDELEKKGLTWKAYMEDMPSACFLDENINNYDRKHNPLISFTTISQNPSRCQNIVPADQFGKDTLPNFSFYAPNEINNGHDSGVATAGTWVKGFLSSNSAKFSDPNTLVVVVFDESDSDANNNQVYALLTGGAVSNRKNQKDATAYTHYSLLKTMLQNWGLASLTSNDQNSNVFLNIGGSNVNSTTTTPTTTSLSSSLSSSTTIPTSTDSTTIDTSLSTDSTVTDSSTDPLPTDTATSTDSTDTATSTDSTDTSTSTDSTDTATSTDSSDTTTSSDSTDSSTDSTDTSTMTKTHSKKHKHKKHHGKHGKHGKHHTHKKHRHHKKKPITE